MSSITCQLLRRERLFENMLTAEIKVVDGVFHQPVGVIEKIKSEDGEDISPSSLHYAEISKKEGIYRLFYDFSNSCHHNFMSTPNQRIELITGNVAPSPLQQIPKKVLLFIDESSFLESLAMIYLLSLHGSETKLYIKMDQNQQEKISYLHKIHPNPIHIVSSFSYQEISPIFKEQVIGTKLFIYGSWSMIADIKKTAYVEGFTDEEIVVNGRGRKSEKIFCVKCYKLNKKKNDDEYETICENCHTLLDVSKHFSKRLDAYLGYIKVV